MRRLVRVAPILALIALLAIVPVMSAFAQGGGTANPVCSGLSDADCAILTGVQASFGSLTSFAIPSMSVSLNATTAKETIALDVKGSGAVMFKSDTDFLVHLMIDSLSETSSGKTTSVEGLEVILNPKNAFVNYKGEWYGQELTAADLNSLGLGSLSGMMGGAGGAGGAGAMDLSSLGIDLTGVVTTTRGADGTVGDAKVAVFTTNIDVTKLLVALLGSPMMGQVLGGASGATTSSMTPQDLQMMGAMIEPMLTGTSISLEESIGVDDSLIHALKLDAVLALDASMLSPTTGKIAGELHLAVEISKVNETVEVTLPTSFKPMKDLQTQLDALTK